MRPDCIKPLCYVHVFYFSFLITHAGIAAGVGRAFSRVRLIYISDIYIYIYIYIRASINVCLFVRALTGKRLELSTSNLVHV